MHKVEVELFLNRAEEASENCIGGKKDCRKC